MFFLIPSSCALYDLSALIKYDDTATELSDSADIQQIVRTDDELTLAWDPPPDPVQSYRIFFRGHGSEDWQQLAEIDAVPSPQYTVLHSRLEDGTYDFGVTAVNIEVAESDVHCSLDPTAHPDTGWYVKWMKDGK